MAYKYKPPVIKNPYVNSTENSTAKALEAQRRNLEKRFLEQGIDPAQFKGDMDKRNILEKALNLKQDQGFLFDIFEIIDRPREAIANTIESTITPGQNALEGFLEGLSGKDRVSSKDAIEDVTGWDLETGNKVADFAIDVALDIGTDPLTFIPGGAIAKVAGKGVSKAGKVGGELLEQGIKRGGKVGSVAQGLKTGAGKVKSITSKVGYAFDATKGMSDKTIDAIGGISGQADTFARKQKGRLAGIQDSVNKIDPAGGKHLGEALEANVIIDSKNVFHYKSMEMSKGQILDNLGNNIKRGKNASLILPRTTRRSLGRENLQRMVNNLNEVGKANFGDEIGDLFKLRKGGKTANAIDFKGTSKEFSELRALDEVQAIMDEPIRFGERRLSKEAENFFRKNEDAKKALEDLRTLRQENLEFIQQLDEAGQAKYFQNLSANVGGNEAMGYMRHTLTESADEYLSESAKAIKEQFIKPGTASFGERSYNASVRDINEALSSIYDTPNELFNQDAFKAMEDMVDKVTQTYGQTEVANILLDPVTKVNGDKQVFKSLSSDSKGALKELGDDYKLIEKGTFKKEFSNLSKNLPPEMQKVLDDMVMQAGGTGDAIGLQKSVYDTFKRFDNAYREVPEFWKSYDKFMNKWKSINLISGGFHMRNFAGNTTNMYLAGMNASDVTKHIGKSMRERKAYKELWERVSRGEVLKGKEKQLFDKVDEFYKSGIAQGHAGVRDLGGVKESIANKAGKEKGVLGKVYDAIESKNYQWAEDADDLQRYAMWDWAKNKYGDVAKANKEVRTALFDYSHLTSFERDVMKRLVPFYTFMKNNMVYQAGNVLKRPEKYARLGRGYQHYISDIAEMEINEMPDYMRDNMWLPIPAEFNLANPEEVSFLKLNLPPAEFAEFVENPLNRGVSSITMPIKLGWELATNRNTFTGAPIEEFPGQTDGGYKDGFRNERGEIAFTGDPTLQKIMNDLGGRQPRNYLTLLADLGDFATGAQGTQETLQDFAKRIGIADTKNMSQMELTKLYQELEKLRNAKKVYEQERGEKLPGLR